MSPSPHRLVITDLGPTSFAVGGEVDAHSAPELSTKLADLPADGHDITVDLSEVSFMDSSGLRVLIEAHQRSVDAGRRLVVAAPSDAVVRLLDVAGLTEHFNLGQ